MARISVILLISLLLTVLGVISTLDVNAHLYDGHSDTEIDPKVETVNEGQQGSPVLKASAWGKGETINHDHTEQHTHEGHVYLHVYIAHVHPHEIIYLRFLYKVKTKDSMVGNSTVTTKALTAEGTLMGPCVMGLAFAQVTLEWFDPDNVQAPNDWAEHTVVTSDVERDCVCPNNVDDSPCAPYSSMAFSAQQHMEIKSELAEFVRLSNDDSVDGAINVNGLIFPLRSGEVYELSQNGRTERFGEVDNPHATVIHIDEDEGVISNIIETFIPSAPPAPRHQVPFTAVTWGALKKG